MSNNYSSSSRLVVIDYQDLVSTEVDLSIQLERAFGGRQQCSTLPHDENVQSPLGIIAIKNVPNFVDAKMKFLPLAHPLAHLEAKYLETHLSDPKSSYNAGWSHGKEKLGDHPDFAKASYYFNPVTENPGTSEERERYPASYPCNKWPNEAELSQLTNFKHSAKRLGKIMYEVVVLLAKHIDEMTASRVNGYSKNLLFDAMKATEKVKGRLLYYYPLEENGQTPSNCTTNEDTWIGWHNDSGFLTSLAGDIYVNDITGQILDEKDVDPEAGLYVMDRSGESVRVTIPKDCMAVQIGECLQILTGGVAVATPHCVRGPRAGWNPHSSIRVARISHPCFIDSIPIFPLCLPAGCSRDDVTRAGSGMGKVPPLEDRWIEDGMSFGDFLQKSFDKYYDWKA